MTDGGPTRLQSAYGRLERLDPANTMTHQQANRRRVDAACSAVLTRVEAADDFRRLVASSEGRPAVSITGGSDGTYTFESDGLNKAVPADSLRDELHGLADAGYSVFAVETHTGVVRVSLTASGLELSYSDAPAGPGADDVSNIDKSYLIRAGEADDLLQAIGIMTSDGRIRAEMRAKFRQVNHMIQLIRPQLEAASRQSRVVVLDLACGKSYLSLVVNYFLRTRLKANCRVMGIDSNPEVIQKSEAVRRRLGYSNMAFCVASIDEFVPDAPVDFLLSLHACDTATDEAIAKGIDLGARFIVAAPCCQHELADQIDSESLASLTKHSMFRLALADIATDALRALALEAMGYRVDVLEFVRPDVTPKNIMLRAEKLSGKTDTQDQKKALAEFRRLRDFFGVDPKIQELIPRLRG